MPLLIVDSVRKMQSLSESLRIDGKKIGLVPTMGALHEGHLKLVKIAKQHSNVVIVSIFVNPTQFGPKEDFSKYPRAFKSDCEKLEKAGANIVFHPSVNEIYPQDYSTYINVGEITSILEGMKRPGHFKGVATICAKLFNITKPHLAVFGQKDGQQFAVIQKMVKDLNFDIKIIKAPIIRTKNGIAMSSRHSYLSSEGLEKAKIIGESLKLAKQLIKDGEKNSAVIKNKMVKHINSINGVKIDYISFNSWDSLKPQKKLSGQIMISLVVIIENVRLLDNVIIRVPN